MADPRLEAVRQHLDAPVAPQDSFVRSLWERLERQLSGPAVSAAEIDAQRGEELPMREAMSLISPDPLGPADLGAVQPGTGPDPPD